MRDARERRELVASLLIVGVVRLALGIALAVSAAQSYHILRRQVVKVPPVAGMVPVALLLGSLVAMASGLQAVRKARRIRRTPLVDTPDSMGS